MLIHLFRKHLLHLKHKSVQTDYKEHHNLHLSLRALILYDKCQAKLVYGHINIAELFSC